MNYKLGLYNAFVKVLAKGSIQPWQRDAYAPTQRDLEMWQTEQHKDTVLAGELEAEEEEVEPELELEAEEVEPDAL